MFVKLEHIAVFVNLNYVVDLAKWRSINVSKRFERLDALAGEQEKQVYYECLVSVVHEENKHIDAPWNTYVTTTIR